MKKILMITALFASGLILSGCGNKPETIETASPEVNTEITGQALIESPELIETESGEIATVTGTNTVSSQIKALIEKRKVEMANETGNAEELNEKDIQFLEAVVAKIGQKK